MKLKKKTAPFGYGKALGIRVVPVSSLYLIRGRQTSS